MNINVSIDTDELLALVGENTREEILGFICAIDSSVAEVDFTIGLIEKLINSLCSDLTPGEIREEVEIILNKK